MDRIQKILARAGYGSRRSCEELIIQGRVTVNGKLAILGSKADPSHDRILLDGGIISPYEEKVYIILNKPRNVISSNKAKDERNIVRDFIPLKTLLFPVGRLDADSEGLLLMTNDGELANRLTHPRYEHEKEYHVLVAHHPDDEQLYKWRRGIALADGFETKPANVHILRKEGKRTWLSVIIKEGHKRQIRELGKILGLPVIRIIRVRMGPLLLGTLKPRQWRFLTKSEISLVKESTQMDFRGEDIYK